MRFTREARTSRRLLSLALKRRLGLRWAREQSSRLIGSCHQWPLSDSPAGARAKARQPPRLVCSESNHHFGTKE